MGLLATLSTAQWWQTAKSFTWLDQKHDTGRNT